MFHAWQLTTESGGGGISCNSEDTVKDVTSTKIFPDPAGWQQAPIPPVISSQNAPATLSEVHSVGYGITVTEGIDLGLNLPDEVGTIGFSASIAWSKTTTDGFSNSVTCPEGNYVCGASTLAQMINISGTHIKIQASGTSCDDPGAETADSPHDPFTFQAPAMLGDKPDVHFSACICSSSGNQTTQPGLGPCPKDC